MKRILILIHLLVPMSFGYGQSISLQLLSTGGELFSNSNYQLEWSVGELCTETYSNQQIILSEGFNQGKFSITSIYNANTSDLEIKAFPNPTNDLIQLTISGYQTENLEYQVSNLTGMLTEKTKITSTKSIISFNSYLYGTYIISITRDNILIHSFKVIKK